MALERRERGLNGFKMAFTRKIVAAVAIFLLLITANSLTKCHVSRTSVVLKSTTIDGGGKLPNRKIEILFIDSLPPREKKEEDKRGGK